METWRSIPGYNGSYEVSDEGRVRSIDRIVTMKNGKSKAITGVELAFVLHSRGYHLVNLWKDGRNRLSMVSHLVLEAFVGPRPAGLVACHRNDVKSDNRLSNLRWDTQSSNLKDAVRNGTLVGRDMTGEANVNAKISRSIADAIRRRANSGEEMKALAHEYGVSYSLVKRIRRGELWP